MIEVRSEIENIDNSSPIQYLKNRLIAEELVLFILNISS